MASTLSMLLCYIFLLHQTTTDKAPIIIPQELCYIFLLHQTTTVDKVLKTFMELCYIFLLHQTTTYFLDAFY